MEITILNTEIICKWLIMIIFQSYDRLQRMVSGGLWHWIYHICDGKSAFKVEIYRRTYWTMFLSYMAMDQYLYIPFLGG
jgi:hypothetical protein